jgi:phage shock protein A
MIPRFIFVLLYIVAAYSFVARNYGINRSRSTTLQMNMFDRFLRVVKSNVNNVLSNLEDPEKVLEQAVNDMQKDLVKIRQSYAEVTATQKRMTKQKEQAEMLSNDWYKRAQLALSKGDEELAKEALSRRQSQVEIVTTLNTQMTTQNVAIDKLYSSMTELEEKIVEAKRQKDLFIARARTAKTSVQVNDMLTGLTSGNSNSMEAFERMKNKVENLEAQAEVAGELAASTSGTTRSLEDKFKLLEGNSEIDLQLEELKKQLPGTKDVIGELPATTQINTDEIDKEYERLKKELGK